MNGLEEGIINPQKENTRIGGKLEWKLLEKGTRIMFGPCNTISQLSRKASSICVPRKRVAQGRWRGKRGEDYRGGEGIKCAKRSWNCSILKIEHGKERRRRKKFTGRLSQGSCSIHDGKCKENTRGGGQLSMEREERQNVL